MGSQSLFLNAQKSDTRTGLLEMTQLLLKQITSSIIIKISNVVLIESRDCVCILRNAEDREDVNEIEDFHYTHFSSVIYGIHF